jgi:hypothetical protein
LKKTISVNSVSENVSDRNRTATIDDEQEFTAPDAETTTQLFEQWQIARRGTHAAEDLSNPVWNWLVRSGISDYHADAHFHEAGGCPAQPRWCFDRMGQTSTKLADGREVLIAGEHEDHYDPDFFIYNDVIIRDPQNRIEILGFPAEVFAPTDFHSASLLDGKSKILLIGNLGYPDDRKSGITQVLMLDVHSKEIHRVDVSGECPGWIHGHQAKFEPGSNHVLISGGKVWREDTKLLENIDDWRLDLRTCGWTRLSDRQWQRLEIRRADSEWLHLWEIGQVAWHEEMGLPNQKDIAELKSKTGIEPDLELYKNRYVPSIDHLRIAEREDEWNVFRIEFSGVTVRFVEDMQSIMMTVEGMLPHETIEKIAKEVCDKLARLENSTCCFDWIEP